MSHSSHKNFFKLLHFHGNPPAYTKKDEQNETNVGNISLKKLVKVI